MKSHLHLNYRVCLLGVFLFCWMAAQDGQKQITGAKSKSIPKATSLWRGDGTDGTPLEHTGTQSIQGRGGVPLWTNELKAATNSNYKVSGAVDNSGNVFVTGSSSGGDHYATVAYSPAGAALWTNLATTGWGKLQ